MQLFARITKVDESARTVEGVIADETPDKSGEIFDYAKSKPHFEEWSTGIAKATEGKNLGNVRVMHGNTVAGVTKELNFDDTAKAITVKAHIADDNEWNKVQAGCYTGFSIGGRYGKKWDDGSFKRYEAIPNEYSLVDLPCNPSAQFTVIKSDGTEELRKFEKVAERKDVNPKEGKDKYGDVTFADETNKKYPINTPAHIRAAWNYINKPKNAAKYDAKDLKTIKSKIVAAWKDKIDANGPPSAEAKKCDAQADSRAAGLMAKIDKAEPLLRTVRAAYGQAPLEKGLWSVSELACLVANLDCITVSSEMEADWEGDNSAVPGELRSIVKELAQILIDMADEEVEELVSAYEKADSGDLNKAATTKEDDAMNAELQKAHDEAKAALAKAEGDLAKANEELTKVTGERDALKAERDELTKGMEQIQAELKKIAEQPAPSKGVARVVEKTLANGDPEPAVDDKPVMKADGTVDNIATAHKLAKLAYRNPASR